MRLSLHTDKQEQERPTPWKDLGIIFMMTKEASSQEQLKIFLTTLGLTKAMKSHTWLESLTSKYTTRY